jgi:excisionase family DNA binding protein
MSVSTPVDLVPAPKPGKRAKVGDPDADLITLATAAVELGVHYDTLARLAREGKFEPAIRIGGVWRVSRPRLRRFLHGDAA